MLIQLAVISLCLFSAISHPISQENKDGHTRPSLRGLFPQRAHSRRPRNAIDSDVLRIIEQDIHTVTHLEHDEQGQCIFVKSEEGVYSYRSPVGSKQVCGLYLIAEPNQFVEIEFERFDLSCSKDAIVSVIDGWELNGQFFPGTKDHPVAKEQRYREFNCESRPRQVFKMSQNVGLVEFRIPNVAEGFRVHVRFVDNAQPCNAVLQRPQGIYTLRNYGQNVNCSVSIIFPESFRILAATIGSGNCVSSSSKSNHVETGIMRQCQQNGDEDFVEIRGGDGLDPDLMEVADTFCGVDSKPENHNIDVFCGNTAVRLVSSGKYDNQVTISFDLLLDWSTPPALSCPRLAGGIV
ncbi:Corticotropin-releasing factor-binding protein [Halotydeus destructor]|nr:Corticotropin-releasing factor-binding protein [Halotydeus destructor]